MNKKKNKKNLLFIIILIILCFCNINTINASDQFKIANVEVISNQTPPIDECFIATAAYGSKNQSYVILLRKFRDDILLTNPIGTKFVETYYHYSPPIANYIAGNVILRLLVRILLIPLVIIAFITMNPVWLVVGLGISSVCFRIIRVIKSELIINN